MKTFLIGLGLLSILGIFIVAVSGFETTTERQECEKILVKLDNKTETQAETCKTIGDLKWENPWAVLWLFCLVYASIFILIMVICGIIMVYEQW